MRVLLFGPLADTAGWRERLTPPAPDVETLKARLGAEDPALGAALMAPGIKVAADQKIIADGAALAGVSEVAFLPPMSGG